MIFSGIINAVGGVATAWMNNKVEETKAKGELKFAALDKAPTWYTASLGVIVAASYGVRSAAKFFRK
jgi:hypothetical protein